MSDLPDPLSDLIHEAGEALYGPNYRGQLAEDLGVRKDTLREWISGRSRSGPPDGLRLDLLRLIDQRLAALTAVRKALDGPPIL